MYMRERQTDGDRERETERDRHTQRETEMCGWIVYATTHVGKSEDNFV